MARKPLMAGNWKMYKTRKEATGFVETLAEGLKALPQTTDVVLCPSFTLLAPVLQTIKTFALPVKVAAQTMEAKSEGAYTGEVSPAQLADLQVDGVVLGHSERRQYFNETDEAIAAKTLAAIAQRLFPIVCVGETLDEREAGQTDAVVRRQVETCLRGLSAEQWASVVIAYEPVWAIGTGKVCDAPEANRVCALIRAVVAELAGETVAQQTRILYGGSMKPDNAESLLAQSDIDGGLVGGASLQPDSFLQLVTLASRQPVQASS